MPLKSWNNEVCCVCLANIEIPTGIQKWLVSSNLPILLTSGEATRLTKMVDFTPNVSVQVFWHLNL